MKQWNPCKQGKELSVLNSMAGYYIGTFDEDGPYCRITPYYSSNSAAQSDLNAFNNDDKKFITLESEEQAYCGCRIGGRYIGNDRFKQL